MSESFALKVFSLLAAIALHCGIVAWAMQPEPPVVVPQKQLIQVSMVAPRVVESAPKTVKPKPPVVPKTAPKKVDLPVKKKGMRKLPEPVKEPVVPPKKEEKKEVKKEPEPKKPPPKEEKKKLPKKKKKTQIKRKTSGAQNRKAQKNRGALTKPRNARHLRNPPPAYPESARRLKQQGTVLLRVKVSTNGRPRWVRVIRSSGYKTLDQRALQTVRRWKFIPARRGSKVVEATIRVPIQFKIRQRRR